MLRWNLTALGLTLGLLTVCVPAWGEDSPPSATELTALNARALSLTKKLGDPSWETRRDADRELADMGRAAEKALRDNLANPDLEVSRRCQRLLALAIRTETEVALDTYLQKKHDRLLLKLPAWNRFSEMAGKDDSARNLFVAMYSSDGGLISELEKDPKNFQQKFTEHCNTLQQMMWNPWRQQTNLDPSQIVALLFTASDPRAKFAANQQFYQITNLLYQPNIQEAFRTDPACHKVLASFMVKHCDQNMLQNFSYLALQMEIRELVPVALKTAISSDRNVQAYQKAPAALLIGKLGTKEDAAKLEPLLNDKTNLGGFNIGNSMIQAELRDVVMASILEANGQLISDFGFPYFQQNPQLIQNQGYVAPQWYGFAKEEERTVAFKKFHEWQSKQKKPSAALPEQLKPLPTLDQAAPQAKK